MKKIKMGLLKKITLSMLVVILSLGMLTGCKGGFGSLIGPGSDYDKQSGETETKKNKQTEEETTSKNGKPLVDPTKNGTGFVASNDVLTDEFLTKLDTIISMVDKYYLYDYDTEEMQNAIYRAVLDSLGDPYSTYYTKEEFDQFLEGSSGTYCGIGVVVQQNVQTGVITAVRPYLNCPGYEAGIRPGDTILKVDGVEVTGMDLNSAVTLIRGEENTNVIITIERDEEQMDLTVTRRKIDVETVTYEMLDNNIGYIAVDEFDEVTAKQFSSALDDLISQGMEGLVVDIRNNPGGLLNIVVEMLDELLPEGTIVSVKDKNGKGDVYTSDAHTKLKVPFCVLINENSASASEIFAGAIQDYGVGTIVGKTSFGKGIVQSIYSFRDGTGVKITIEDYYTPSGRSIHKLGVTPDVEVELPDEAKVLVDIPYEIDTQLQKAIEIITEQIK